MKARHLGWVRLGAMAGGFLLASSALLSPAQAQAPGPAPGAPAQPQPQKRPNIVMLMTDDTGWNDFGGIREEARP
jgi:hypothetical protein